MEFVSQCFTIKDKRFISKPGSLNPMVGSRDSHQLTTFGYNSMRCKSCYASESIHN